MDSRLTINSNIRLFHGAARNNNNNNTNSGHNAPQMDSSSSNIEQEEQLRTSFEIPQNTGINAASALSTGSTAQASSCRICRYNRNDMEVLQCPCNCKGSVGYVHLQCLKRWILHRRSNRCEVCNAEFVLPEEKSSIKTLISSFFTRHYFEAILRNSVYGISSMPMLYIVLQQVLMSLDKVGQDIDEPLTASKLLITSAALLTSSALSFHCLEYLATRLFTICNALSCWWMFGGSEDFTTMDIGIDIFNVL